MALGLHLKLTGENAQLSGVLANTQKRVQQFAVSIGTFLKGALINRAVNAAVNAVGDPFEKIRKAFDQGGALKDLRARTGVAVRDLQILQVAFKDTGVGAEKVGPSVNKLQKALTGLNEDGMPTNKAFQTLGLSLEELEKLTTVEQFSQIGAALRTIEDPARRSQAVMQLFGKSGGEMLAFFEDAGVLDSAATTLGTQAEIMARNVDLFDKISDMLGHVGIKVQGFFVGVADKIAPVLLPLLERFEKMDFAKWGQQIGEAVAMAMEAFGSGGAGDILATSFNLAARTLGNALYGVLQAFSAGLSALFSADFAKVLGNVLLGSATLFMVKLLQGVRAAVVILAGGMQFVAQELYHALYRIPGMEKILGAQGARQTFVQHVNAASDKETALASVIQKGNADGNELVSHGQGGALMARVGEAFKTGLRATLLDTSGEKSALGVQIDTLRRNVRAKRAAADEVAAKTVPGFKMDPGAGSIGGALIASSMAKIGGGGNVAGGSFGLQREANFLLKQIALNTGKLGGEGAVTVAVPKKPQFV